MKEIKVIKSSGIIEPFSEEKLSRSLNKSGVDNVLSAWIVDKIKSKMRKKIPSSYIHQKTLEMLQAEKPDSALKYKLKQAIMELGPSGHPFEKLISKIFISLGYDVKINVFLKGKCVLHEVDVVAKDKKDKFMIEAKYHNEKGIKTDVKVAMYVKARFDDLALEDFTKCWLFTNTKLTHDAGEYALCSGMNAIGWNYPASGNLQNLLEKNNLYPLTVLNSLGNDLKKRLLDKGIILASEITGRELSNFGLSLSKKEAVLKEISYLS
jgi:hypothetical protein